MKILKPEFNKRNTSFYYPRRNAQRHFKTCLKYFLLITIVFAGGCKKKIKDPKIPYISDIRFTVVSKKCQEIVYSINVGDVYQPWLLTNAFGPKPKNRLLDFGKSQELFPQSISCDCRTIAVYDFDKDQQKRNNMYFYDLKTGKLDNIKQKFNINAGEGSFGPISTLYAYLDDSLKLQVLNYISGKHLKVFPPANIKFRYFTWSTHEHFIFLEDYDSNIWKYELVSGIIKEIWHSPNKSDYSKELTVALDDENEFYFRSDHESDFTQIYRYSPKGTFLIFSSPYIKTLNNPVSHDSLVFRIFKDGLVTPQLYYNKKLVNLYPAHGVLYGYYPGRYPLYLYSDHQHPYSIYSPRKGRMQSLIPGMTDTMPDPQVIKNKYGFSNLIYFPNGDKPVTWVVNLHGGPHQEVFRKYDRFLAYLLHAGIGVINLNYPGSTATGKSYEMRDRSDLFDVELQSIDEDLNQITNRYPEIKKFTMLGISYSSQLTHRYSNDHSRVSALIDLSGYGHIAARPNIPILYIYGKNDYAFDDPQRVKMMNKEIATGTAEKFELPGEGHVIAHKKSTLKLLQQITKFLNEKN